MGKNKQTENRAKKMAQSIEGLSNKSKDPSLDSQQPHKK